MIKKSVVLAVERCRKKEAVGDWGVTKNLFGTTVVAKLFIEYLTNIKTFVHICNTFKLKKN